MPYITPSKEQIQELMGYPDDHPIFMINLLKFKERVEDVDKSGEEVYREYGEKVFPILQKVGGEVIWQGQMQLTVIGSKDDIFWDELIVVRYPGRKNFFALFQDPAYPGSLRSKSLDDSRLILSKEMYSIHKA
ncbi:MAG: hypothetical protein AAFU64_11755 [Bacteroidota bacterium]